MNFIRHRNLHLFLHLLKTTICKTKPGYIENKKLQMSIKLEISTKNQKMQSYATIMKCILYF